MIDNLAHCAPRPTGIPGDNICNIGNWADVKSQARTMLGIRLVDSDIFDVPLILTDAYGHFKPGPARVPQMIFPAPGPPACRRCKMPTAWKEIWPPRF